MGGSGADADAPDRARLLTESGSRPEQEEGLALVCHPDFPSSAVHSIVADARRRGRDELRIRYLLAGALDEVLWPGIELLPDRQGPIASPDELWRHSCFEAFVGGVAHDGYRELNFNSAGQKAAYDFDGYRSGKRDVDVASWGHWNLPVSRLEMNVFLPDLAEVDEWRLGLAVILEQADGSKSYWALRHPPGRPDFHHPDCFAARLPAPAGA